MQFYLQTVVGFPTSPESRYIYLCYHPRAERQTDPALIKPEKVIFRCPTDGCENKHSLPLNPKGKWKFKLHGCEVDFTGRQHNIT